jgi:hypothetical protein
MSVSIISSSSQNDRELWENLQAAIANTSGFESWEAETNVNTDVEEASLEDRVSVYLRSTLETLAY